VEKDPIRNDRRRARRARRLGEDATCLLCGYRRNTRALRNVSRHFLEEHHLLGWATDETLTAWLCLNCHAEATDDQLTHGVDLHASPQRPVAEQVADELRQMGAILVRLGERVADDGYRLDPSTCLGAPESSDDQQSGESSSSRLR
jgi:hypothetical protein